MALAEALTQSLRNTGDLDLIDIDMQAYVLQHPNAKAFSQGLTYTGKHRFRHRTTTKSCFRQRGDRNSSNPSCFSFVHLLFSTVLFVVSPLTLPSVANAGRNALHATPHALLGIHHPARTDRRHRKGAGGPIRPCSAGSQWAKRRSALPYRFVGRPSCPVQRLGDSRTFRSGSWECPELLYNAT